MFEAIQFIFIKKNQFIFKITQFVFEIIQLIHKVIQIIYKHIYSNKETYIIKS